MLDFQNRAPNIKLLQFHANQDDWAYVEKRDSNGSSFQGFEIAIGFVASKQVWEWSRILISSPGWLYTQNETQLN